jgi:hypothetical protein
MAGKASSFPCFRMVSQPEGNNLRRRTKDTTLKLILDQELQPLHNFITHKGLAERLAVACSSKLSRQW